MKTIVPLLVLVALLLAACSGQKSSPPPVDYNAEMATQMGALGDFSRAAGPILDNPQFDNEAWRGQVIEQTAKIATVYESVAALKPPSDQLSKHLAILSGLGDCSAAMRALTLAIDNNRPDFAPVSVGLVNRCTDKLTNAANP